VAYGENNSIELKWNSIEVLSIDGGSLVRIKLESGVADTFGGTHNILSLRVLAPFYQWLGTGGTNCQIKIAFKPRY
jgi:hypothetical protein